MNENYLNRRDFIVKSGLVAGGLAASPAMSSLGNVFNMQ